MCMLLTWKKVVLFMESSESPRYIKGQYAWSRTFETDLKNRKDLMPKRRVKVSKRA